MKRLLFVMQSGPVGSIQAQEALDAVLMGSAFAECALLLLGDGIMQLLEDQQPEAIGTKPYTKTFGALKDYGVSHIYSSVTDLSNRGITTDDLQLEVEALSDTELGSLLQDYEVILSF